MAEEPSTPEAAFSDDENLVAGAPQATRRMPRVRNDPVEEGNHGNLPREEDMTMEELRSSLNDLKRTLRVAVTRIESMEQDRRGTRGASIGTLGEEFGLGGRNPKLERPREFGGEYSVLYSVLNWIASVDQYLKQHERLAESEYSVYARTYMSQTVQAWMDAQYGVGAKPPWEDLQEEMKDRYLPADHDLQLESKFEKIWQQESLVEYVENFQVLVSAMIFAGVIKTEKRLILQFIKGLTQEEDRRFMAAREPQTLKATYKSVTMLRQVKTVSGPEGVVSTPGRKHAPTEAAEGDKHPKFFLLSAAEKQRAFETGRCVGCGKSGHFISQCPLIKRAIKMLQDLRTQTSPKQLCNTKTKKHK